MNIIITLIILILTYHIIKYFWSRRWLYYYSSRMHGPRSWPIIGNALHLAGGPDGLLEIIMNLVKKYNKSPLRLWLGPKLFVVLSQPQDLAIVLNQSLHKDESYKFAQSVVGNGLFTAPVDKWKRHRKIISQTFNQEILNNFVDIFAQQSNILVEKLDEHVASTDGGFFDVFPLLSRCSLDIISETAMGEEIHCQTQQCDYVKWLERTMELCFIRMYKVWYHSDFVWNLTSYSRENKVLAGKIEQYMKQIIVRKRQEFRRQKQLDQDDEDHHPTTEVPRKRRRKAFLDLLIELSETGDHLWTDNEVIEEASTMMIAGSDTAASMDSFALVMLGMHPTVQGQAYEEQCSIFGHVNRNVTADDLTKMVYLERVIKETMRLFPAGPLVARDLHCDIELRDGEYVLPKGSFCALVIIGTHRDPNLWPDPLHFDPDRFRADAVAKRMRGAYVPFSGGARNCIGTRYAMMVMKAVLSTIIRNFHVKTSYERVDEIKVKSELVIRAVDGCQVTFERRKKII